MAPQGWVWMGDSIYADDATPDERAAAYRRVQSVPAYAGLASSGFLAGTWDDHDYARNNAGADYRFRDESKRVFLDFLGEPAGSPRRRREGVYDAKVVGSVQLLMLDTRYFKPRAGRQADLLGPAQWSWLESEMARRDVALRVVVSSIQVLPDFTDKETWAQFPRSRERLLALVAASSVPVVLLSGDRHLVETSRLDLGSGKVVHEMTSSGLTHKTDRTNANRYRVGRQILEKNFGMMRLDWDGQKLKGLSLSAHAAESGERLTELVLDSRWG